jgi:CRP-like cAMP-binding protein
MGFTPDQLPAIGFLRPGLIVAAGFNGYGGSYTTAAGHAAALMALTDTTPGWVPADVFSPNRFLDDEPPFMRNHESLWRIAASLCRQLRTVDEHAAEIQAFAGPQPVHDARTPARPRRSPAGQPTLTTARVADDIDRLRRLTTFGDFTSDELGELLGLTRRWDATHGALVCAEGDLDRSCFVVLSGSVQVSGYAGGRERQLAVLGPGSIFGQVSLIDGGARSATCWMRQPGALLELQEAPCARLLASRTPLALKLLSALNQGLIAALRGADRRLMKLDRPPVSQAQTEVLIPM